MDRRHFLKQACAGTLLAGLPAAGLGAAVDKPSIPGALGLLYDSTLCVGCQACVATCQRINQSPRRSGDGTIWADNDKLSPYTNTVIQVWRAGDGAEKDRPQNGYAYIKKQCMHCLEPNCVAVCPVGALQKNPRTGVVHYDPSVCTGCRYCMVACPFNVPKYDYDNPLGRIHKCELCNQQGLERLDRGLLPGCAEVCPTGAVIFGTREQLLAEAKRRLALKAGVQYPYPRQALPARDTYWRTVAHYDRRLYGEADGGGTQVLVLAGVPYDCLGLPRLGTVSAGARAEHIQHTLYRGMALPLAALATLSVLVRRATRDERKPPVPPHSQDDDHDRT
ncbi:hydrogenase 2 operon protein HybA [Martelella alba]|uniref:Hydrogenase 2 operon protein HybA n=1 Tax=Martelella alba TaxID=2590451 RepID=A0ABY2SMN5_9HYPH|nr:hydrogenase 2 operon protein HybA [Martelella alba]TKI06478.1 hydrogenase 2 operon protein HybA [Martelella alba]